MVSNPAGGHEYLSVVECCVLSGEGVCDELITRPEKSYRLWCVVVCDLETSRMRPWPALGSNATGGKKYSYKSMFYVYIYITQSNSETLKGKLEMEIS